MAKRDLARRLDRLVPKARPVFIWIDANDTQKDVAAKIGRLDAADRSNVVFIGWQDAAEAMGRAKQCLGR